MSFPPSMVRAPFTVTPEREALRGSFLYARDIQAMGPHDLLPMGSEWISWTRNGISIPEAHWDPSWPVVRITPGKNTQGGLTTMAVEQYFRGGRRKKRSTRHAKKKRNGVSRSTRRTV
jgi:hypothetical protein